MAKGVLSVGSTGNGGVREPPSGWECLNTARTRIGCQPEPSNYSAN